MCALSGSGSIFPHLSSLPPVTSSRKKILHPFSLAGRRGGAGRGPCGLPVRQSSPCGRPARPAARAAGLCGDAVAQEGAARPALQRADLRAVTGGARGRRRAELDRRRAELGPAARGQDTMRHAVGLGPAHQGASGHGCSIGRPRCSIRRRGHSIRWRAGSI
jgi:hypothetical protein